MNCTEKVVIDTTELIELFEILDKVRRLLPYHKQEHILYKGVSTIDSDIPLQDKRRLQKLYNYRLKTFRVLNNSFNSKCIFSCSDGKDEKCAVLEICEDSGIKDCRPRSCR